jgi:hypothetical protein
MNGYSSALVWMALAAQVVAWPVARLHEATNGLMRLPPNDRAIVERLLRPQLGPLVQGEGAGQLDKAIHSFRAERLTLGGTPALAIQPTGDDFCGGTGNCLFWIIDLHQRRILLRAEAIQQFSVDQNPKHGFPDVITGTHESASESELIRWQFAAGAYQAAACATVDYSDSAGNPLPQPKTTPHPCSSEGN